MTELSTTEAKQVEQVEQVEQAAKELLPKGRVYAFNIGWQAGFDDGIDYALSHILPSRMIGFMEWFDNAALGVSHAGNGEWYDNNGAMLYTSQELYQKYNEYLK